MVEEVVVMPALMAMLVVLAAVAVLTAVLAELAHQTKDMLVEMLMLTVLVKEAVAAVVVPAL